MLKVESHICLRCLTSYKKLQSKQHFSVFFPLIATEKLLWNPQVIATFVNTQLRKPWTLNAETLFSYRLPDTSRLSSAQLIKLQGTSG